MEADSRPASTSRVLRSLGGRARARRCVAIRVREHKGTGQEERVPGSSEIVWRPSPELIERANVTRLMRAHGIGSYDELVRRSQDDPDWFWDAVVKDLGLEFFTPYERVMDPSRGIPWTTWFTGGTVNLAHPCVDVWAERTPDAPAVIWEGEDFSVRTVTYREL